MNDVVVIGAGIFGSVITQALRSIGRRVILLDAERKNSGSYPAACLMKHSWLSGLGKNIYDPALKMLDQLYGLKEVSFRVGKVMDSKVFWIPPKEILHHPYQKTSIKRISREGSTWKLSEAAGAVLEAKVVVVAAGIWTSLLVPQVQQKGLAGVAFLYPDEHLAQPFVKPWAPFKQIVGFNRGDGLWVGDGSAILERNWNSTYERKSLERCKAALGFEDQVRPVKRMFGIRPYHVAKPCFLEEVKPGLWVATGGAKNGTLAAGWCAHKLMGQLQ